jgi:hypothetical protein
LHTSALQKQRKSFPTSLLCQEKEKEKEKEKENSFRCTFDAFLFQQRFRFKNRKID